MASAARGGMRSKVEAARIAANSGVQMVIARASRANVIPDASRRQAGGHPFPEQPERIEPSKALDSLRKPRERRVTINEGARKVLVERGKSLLAAGIVGCEGTFRVGDLVAVIDEKGEQIARGLTNYAAAGNRANTRKAQRRNRSNTGTQGL